VRRQLHAAELVQFVLPGALVASLLIRNEWMQPAGASRARFATLARLLAPFLAGFALPVAIFLIPFAREHAVGSLVRGVFLLPTKRFGVAAYPMLSPWSMLALLPVWLVLAYGRRLAGRMTRWHVLALVAVLTGYLVATREVALLYRLVWYAARGALPVLVLLGVVLLARTRGTDALPPLARSRLMLLLSASALLTLVQFPFSAPIYFCYVAPLVVLLGAALLTRVRPMAPAVPAAFLVFLIAFAVTRTNTSRLFGMGVVYLPFPRTTALGLPRGGLEVPVQDAAMYRSAVELLQRHARGGFAWASPDSPEIYFLSGLSNPTRTLFDDFDDQAGRTARILGALQAHGVTAIVLNNSPHFADGIPGDLMNAVVERYPYGSDIGKFQVRWQ
jgi:hypothetical protein